MTVAGGHFTWADPERWGAWLQLQHGVHLTQCGPQCGVPQVGPVLTECRSEDRKDVEKCVDAPQTHSGAENHQGCPLRCALVTWVPTTPRQAVTSAEWFSLEVGKAGSGWGARAAG